MTAQSSDTIYYRGELLDLVCEPLYYYFEKLAVKPKFLALTTSNWRGYHASWEIEDDVLYLKAFAGNTEEGSVNLDGIFPGNNGRVPASWYSGMIEIAKGRTLIYIHSGYESLREFNILLEIDNGKVLSEKLIDNREQITEYYCLFCGEKFADLEPIKVGLEDLFGDKNIEAVPINEGLDYLCSACKKKVRRKPGDEIKIHPHNLLPGKYPAKIARVDISISEQERHGYKDITTFLHLTWELIDPCLVEKIGCEITHFRQALILNIDDKRRLCVLEKCNEELRSICEATGQPYLSAQSISLLNGSRARIEIELKKISESYTYSSIKSVIPESSGMN